MPGAFHAPFVYNRGRIGSASDIDHICVLITETPLPARLCYGRPQAKNIPAGMAIAVDLDQSLMPIFSPRLAFACSLGGHLRLQRMRAQRLGACHGSRKTRNPSRAGVRPVRPE
jgi:hypothetical protein